MNKKTISFIKKTSVGLALSSFFIFSGNAFAIGTHANTDVINTAVVTYTQNGTTQSTPSNSNKITVQQVLGVSVTPNDASNVPVLSPDTGKPLSFTVTNVGNGTDKFKLTGNSTIPGDGFDPTLKSIYLDSNNDGIFELGTDTLYVPGSNDPTLNPDQSIIAFVVNDVPSGVANQSVGKSTLEGTSDTGSGAPGTVVAGKGNGGVDAIVGTTRADVTSGGAYIVSTVVANMVKSQSVLDPSGGNQPVSGAVITYTLTVTATNNGSLYNFVVNDNIPAGTVYLKNSLKYDGTSLTDATDTDAGQVVNGAVTVNVGTLVSPSTHIVTFQVTII